MLDNINYANNELNNIRGYSNCLSDLSSELSTSTVKPLALAMGSVN